MTTMNRFAPVLGVAAVLALGACTTVNSPTPNSYPPATTSYPDQQYPSNTESRGTYDGYGVVESINPVQQGYEGVGGTGYGLGTLAGAVIGGVAGNQVGSGRGNTAATIAGSAGGAYIGHQLEKRNQEVEAYAITIRMDNGAYQTLTLTTPGGLRVGDHVRIDKGSIQRY
ncbi:glycine zipper 2TM domain-containing protein [Pseudomonas sp. sp1636]|uniref:glycine zipper 2TM domain-containing protein n=1 Tax=Pseudomonas sp. sp1636 TaxID=3036707 RepID=UPI0025A54D86|nr:glycine zipper 2TM domain-containing protein [Pseudomonas sp. sp1636]MDM8349705.1 glycine zipper 2TM domain-containing protein [Pseudomonas sp. sp1636]